LGGVRPALKKAAPNKGGKPLTPCRLALPERVDSTCRLAIDDSQVMLIDGHRRIFLSESRRRVLLMPGGLGSTMKVLISCRYNARPVTSSLEPGSVAP
jgi:hypothetical protein